jgi:nucleoside-diphosphate-sugar epimerase
MNVAVTGAAGFVGRHLVESLLKKGFTVQAIDRNEAGLATHCDSAEIMAGDIGAERTIRAILDARPDLVLHAAWDGLSDYKSIAHFESTLFKHYFFLKALIQGGVHRIQALGTCFEYGMRNGCLAETCPAKPVTAYGCAKHTLHVFLQELQKTERFSLQWCRLFYVYGTGQNPKSLLGQLDKAIEHGAKTFKMSMGEQLRDYLPIKKAADLLARIAANESFDGTINCCSGTPVSVRKLVEDRLKHFGSDIQLELGAYPYAEYEPMAFWGSTDCLRSVAGKDKEQAHEQT